MASDQLISNDQDSAQVNTLEMLPWHIVDGIVKHLDLNTCLNLACVSPYLESRVKSKAPTGYIVVMIPTRNGQIIDKWLSVKNKYNRRWTLHLPLDEEAASAHLIKELFRLVSDLQAIRIIDYELVDLVLKIGRETPGLFSNLRLFEYEDTFDLSDKRSVSLFNQIKTDHPHLGKIRNIRHSTTPYGFMACYKVWADCPQF